MDGEVKYAGFWLRFTALLLDGIVIAVASFIFQSFVSGNVLTPPDLSEVLETVDDIPRFLMSAAGTLMPIAISNSMFLLICILYWVVLTWKFGGTLGKMAVGIKVVREDLKPISFGGALVREFFVKQILYLILIFISWLGYLWVLWDKKKQGWHDKIARTLVIKEVMPARPDENLGEVSPRPPGGGRIKPEEPVNPVEPPKPPEQAKPAETIKPVDTVTPVGQVKSDEVSVKVNLLKLGQF